MTLFETLVVLAILAITLGLSVARLRPSDGLIRERARAELASRAAALRLDAVRTAGDRVMTGHSTACTGTETRIVFHADGTASGNGICFERGESAVLLVADPLTGRLQEAGR